MVDGADGVYARHLVERLDLVLKHGRVPIQHLHVVAHPVLGHLRKHAVLRVCVVVMLPAGEIVIVQPVIVTLQLSPVEIRPVQEQLIVVVPLAHFPTNYPFPAVTE